MTQSLPLNFSGLIGTNSSRAECHRSASGEPMEQQVLTTLRDQVGPIMLGTVFLFVGVVACALAPIRGLKEKGHSPVVWPAEHHVWSSHSGLSADSVQHASSDLVGQPPRCYCDSLLRDRGSRAAFLSGNESWNPAPNPANHV